MQRNDFKHIIGWFLYSIFLFVIFNLVTDTTAAFIRTAIIVVVQLLVFYVNLKWILPKFYEQKNYVTYGGFNLLFLAIGIYLNSYFINKIPFYNITVVDYYDNEYIEVIGLLDLEVIFTYAMPIILVIFLSFFLYTFQRRKDQEEKELAIVTAEKNFLVQQINPHFLFNTLNNIYFLTYKLAPKGSKAIMQLSKMLDYSLYGTKEGNVTLENEIAYLNNFVALFKLKDSKIKNIKFDYSKANVSQKITPMLLLPFVENAFKHGNIEDIDSGFITIELTSKGANVSFKCSNSYSSKKAVDRTGGIGIKNVTRRLELLYPNKHTLEINNTEKEYIVSLKINTNV